MAMTRQERVNSQKKQYRINSIYGAPTLSDLREGVPVLRKTSEGVVEYVKFEGELHKKVLSRV